MANRYFCDKAMSMLEIEHMDRMNKVIGYVLEEDYERLTAEVANLKEQLAAREANIADVLEWYNKDGSVGGCSIVMETLRAMDDSSLREHEIRLLESLITAMESMQSQNFGMQPDHIAFLKREAVARRTK